MKNTGRFASFIVFLSICLTFLLLSLHVSASDQRAMKSEESSKEIPKKIMDQYASLEKKWGIKPVVIRLTGAGNFLDFRYRVTDANKAQPVLNRKKKACLKDEETGKVYSVPVTKIGTLRSTSVKPKENRQYFILFANTDKAVKKGKKVSVIIDEFKVEGMTVE